MFFQKNLPGIERAIRVAIGFCLICFGLLFAQHGWMTWSAIGAGVIAACTGFIGFCPMCAMAGRTLQVDPLFTSIKEGAMFCSTSVGMHLLRGGGALALIALAIHPGSSQPLHVVPLILGAVLLLRGCPMCWLIGLVQTIGNKRT
ncbi:DUF2892 domain-containing protein [Massilia sp. Dwa41.01b]|uniref:YgaP family membrane protein n=1 Tax=unclassified Massilia TaxID=2609279 RepID=UPI0015FF4682|nr:MULTISPECIES: DUF2892 domain-containing protein [unclassified Massilia]QNA87974.1 DUF2892 domain-containing protein [Massilia sp. Dwa41.01b]QNA98876.1 DUF2892 domain-containing protein [Massilia sp. Se16.2.3]